MALPPGFIDELRTRITLSDVVGRKVVWDRRKSNPAKGDWWAPCPFHQEKTPSFHVDDRKGFYYCFGCQAKGDAIGFVTEIENLPFMEAVERLAGEAGMEVPRHDGVRGARAREARDTHARLHDVMEQAVRLFQLALRGGSGDAARDYLAGRGLADATLKRFEIGFAPDSRTHQTAHFQEKGVLEDAIAAGLAIRPDDGGAPFDRFRNRVMFPIRDARGRCIAFGARALSPEARAKYLNSPETPVFSKGRALYNHAPAREAAARAGTVVVAEGYMDVIALAQAGFAHAVAPLGTAVTAEQLQLLWRMADEPVIALDGDEAGARAANRLVDLALPLLAPGKSLRFCILPEGQDPDDLIRAGGAAVMGRALEGARPLIEQLWLRETAAPLDTPERRAALDQRLRAALGSIADASVRNHYAAEIRTRRQALYRRPDRPGRQEARGARWQAAGAGGFRPWRGRGR
ncbi:MAG TPA: DNA primase, partial [Thermohalobaculum sp.]|nr:DNA primase [Thermohalobaculum sp.]